MSAEKLDLVGALVAYVIYLSSIAVFTMRLAMGGMIGIASLAGRLWAIGAVVLFLIAGTLAFVARWVTGV